MYKDEKIKQVWHMKASVCVWLLLQIFQISQKEFGILNRISCDEREDYAEY